MVSKKEMKINFEVKGEPVGYSNGEKEKRWRKDIYTECENNIKTGKFKRIDKEIKLKVEIAFYLTKERLLKNNDLDNLSKPVLDTICKVKSKNYPTGALFTFDDDNVVELILHKRLKIDNEKEKAVIKISEFTNI